MSEWVNERFGTLTQTLNFIILGTILTTMNRLDKYISLISQLCKVHKVNRLYAFGSILTDDFNSQSDVDLIVDFQPMNLEDYADNYFDFKFSLQEILKRPVDLLEEQAIKNPYLRQSVNEQGQIVYGH
jgi:uncharacterized protein